MHTHTQISSIFNMKTISLHKYYVFWMLCISCVTLTRADYTQFDCPLGWDEFADHCYRFIVDEPTDIVSATTICEQDSGFVVSILSDFEHSFIVGKLELYDSGSTRRDWWTSGRREEEGVSMTFFWEGDGQPIESYFYWLDPAIPENMDLDRIQYHYNGYEWGWILGEAHDTRAYICKVSKEHIFMINYRERGPDYGLTNPEEETIPRGPSFLVIPRDTIYEEYEYIPLETWYNPFNDRSEEEMVTLYCEADAYPPPEYTWYRKRHAEVEEIDLNNYGRYTLINGDLVIHQPSPDQDDQGEYRCLARNMYGSIISPWIKLDFGYMQDFSTSPRTPIEVPEFSFATIPCHPPDAYPSLVFAWYKNDIRNFVRPDLKPHMFISMDGILYFSSVTTDDEGDYYCIVNKPGYVLTAGKRSQNIALNVKAGNPGDYDPQIGDSFPKMFPENSLVGESLRIECWAYGATENRHLQYRWNRVEYDEEGEEVILPLPKQAVLDDSNRILNIPNAQSYDQGTYKCTVTKPSFGTQGATVSKTIPVALGSSPYFVSPLGDQFVDEGTSVEWVCKAIGDPAVRYRWYKNGLEYTSDSIPPSHRSRITIRNNRVVIDDVQEVDNGMYQCEAYNSHASNFSSAELRVLSFAPVFSGLAVQEDMMATNGGNMTIFCQPEGAPEPEITWLKNGSPLNPGTNPEDRVRKMPNGNLFISPVQFGDAGEYRCDATNIYGTANSTGTLRVLEEITMALEPTPQVVEVNKTTFLFCQASHNPQMDVTYVWYQGDMLIIFMKVFRLGENRYETWYDPHFKAGTGMFTGGLYIMNAQFWHKGRYTCKVQAGSTEIERYADVDVIGPPSEPAGVKVIDGSVNTTSAQIQWKASSNNGAPLLSFVIESFNVREGFWRIIRTNILPSADEFGTYLYTVNDLRPNSQYHMRVRAENRMGTSVPSEPSELITTDPVKPDMYPEMIGGGGGKVGDLTVTWKPLAPWEENGPGIGYRIYWKLTGDEVFPDQRIVEVMGSVGEHVILVGQDDYYLEYDIMVQAFNDLGSGPLPAPVTIRSAMGMPSATATNVKAQPYNSTACIVNWTPVPDTRISVKGKLGGYKMGYWEASMGRFFDIPERVTLNGQQTQGMVIGLKPNTRYYFNVYVWTDAGNGPPSTYFEQDTLRQAPVNQPTEVRVHKIDDQSVYVWWRGVSTDQTEEPLEGYTVRIWRVGEHIKNATDYNARKDTTLTVGGLLPEEPYKLRVFGYSRGGWGTMSSPAVRFTLASASAMEVSFLTLFACLLVCLAKNLRINLT